MSSGACWIFSISSFLEDPNIQVQRYFWRVQVSKVPSAPPEKVCDNFEMSLGEELFLCIYFEEKLWTL